MAPIRRRTARAIRVRHTAITAGRLVALMATLLLGGVTQALAANTTACDRDNGGIHLPDGFCATVFASDLGPVRHMAIRDDGVVYAILAIAGSDGAVVALRDRDGDGHADEVRYFGDSGGTGIGIHDGYLYLAHTTEIVRYRLPRDGLVPQGDAQTVVSGIPQQSEHDARSIAFGDDGWLYMNSGAPSNSCQEHDRTPRSPGIDPCPLLELHGGIWRFLADETGQKYAPDQRYATGIRNAVALAWNPLAKHLYAVQHGRDQLHQNWPKRYTARQGAELPAEELLRVGDGDNFGWPYCYYDQQQEKLVLMPEYGGNGHKTGRCEQFQGPIMAFPAHWAPNGLLFYTGRLFPARYHGGAFIAFHGSWNRSPLPQEGYRVVFVPFDGARPAGKYENFATGFAGNRDIASSGAARHRPTGVAQGPRGALYISDDRDGRIWRVIYTGNKGQ